MAIYQITVTSVTPVTSAESFNGMQGDFFKRCGCPVDTSAEGRSTDRPAGETCTAGKTTAVVEGRALTARENVRPVGADFPQRYSPSESPRSRGPRKSRQTFRGGSDIFAALLKVS